MVRVDLVQAVEALSREGCRDVRDAELLLADDLRAAAPQQFVVREQAARNGVLDGRNAQQRQIFGHAAEELVEAPAGDDLQLLAREVAAGGRFVEASCNALYGDSFHGVVICCN